MISSQCAQGVRYSDLAKSAYMCVYATICAYECMRVCMQCLGDLRDAFRSTPQCQDLAVESWNNARRLPDTSDAIPETHSILLPLFADYMLGAVLYIELHVPVVVPALIPHDVAVATRWDAAAPVARFTAVGGQS
jgi:hypothetical protein